MLLSYIIPLYNASLTIDECLSSIYSEGSPENTFEVIVVDDGSKDGGSEIVNRYAQHHGNLKLIQQANAGASSARNKGLNEAQGQWIRFVDADDRIQSFRKPIYQILNEYKDADLLTFNYISLETNQELHNEPYHTIKEINGLELLRHERLYLWDKIFSRNLIGENRFVQGTVNQEDMFFCIQTLPDANHVVALPEFGYVYDCRSNTSTTRTKTPRQYVRNYKDSIVIQSRIKQITDSMPKNETRQVLGNILHESVINHFYIILKYYSYNRVLKAIRDYTRVGLYPLGFCINKEKNMFAKIANKPFLLKLIARIRWGKLF